MKDFLPRWCHANVSREMRDESEEDIRREADDITQILIKTVENNAPVRELAEIPLLLTLLAAMQQKGTTLPDRRAGLYKLVVKTLLTDRNKAKELETLSVADAHQRLGLLAYEMHTHNSLALDEDYIHQKLAEAIHSQQGKSPKTPIDASEETEAKSYLSRLSERGGLFVKRAGNYYDFSHRSFEEYFTAQYLLRQIELNRQKGIQDFVERIVHNYSLWREPYLLAVASKSENDGTTGGTTASQLIRSLFQSPLTASYLNLLLLTATAIIEAEPNSIDLALQREIADALIQRYTEALRTKKFEDCERIEQIMIRWLLTLPKDAFRPPVLLSLQAHVCNAAQAQQRATLKLLAMVMPDILTGSPQIFNTLMPTLLALSGQPAVKGNERTVEPASDIPISSDLTVRDYAFTVLSFMGRRGPGGLLLSKIREEVEPYLEQLAYYSLECGTLITPTNIPLSEEKYVHYEVAIKDWFILLDELEKRPKTADGVKRYADIHKALLTHAEEVNYATAPVIATILVASAHSYGNWKQIWQTMLLNQLQANQDILYFNSALLWTALFIEKDESVILAKRLKQDFQEPTKQLSATRFIAYIAEHSRDLQYFRILQGFRDLQIFRHFRGLQVLRDLRSLRHFRYFRYFRYFRHFRGLQGLQGLQSLRDSLFIDKIAQMCLRRINRESSDVQVDLLLIILGRVLQIGEEFPSTLHQQQIHSIIQGIMPFCASTIDDVRDAALDILRYLPVRTGDEIRFVIEGAEQAKDEQVRDAYCDALRRIRQLGKSEQDVLKQLGMKSQVKAVCAATEVALSRIG